MKEEKFYNLLTGKDKLKAEDLFALKEIIRRFPYFQTARIMHLLYLHGEKSSLYPEELPATAIYSNDRSKLKFLIENGLLPATATASAEPETNGKENEEKKEQEDIRTLLTELKNKIEKLLAGQGTPENIPYLHYSEQLQQIEEIISREKEKPTGTITPSKEKATGFSIEELEKLPEIEQEKSETTLLIERFLTGEQNERKKTPFFDPVKAAEESLKDNEDIISETLAQLYYRQGNVSKAIKIYKKLMLLHPKKSSYFANLIKKLEEKDN